MNAPVSKTGLPEEIVFYCKDCHKIAPVQRLGRRYVYTCAVCGTKNVAFGTTRSIARYFRVEELPPSEIVTSASAPESSPVLEASPEASASSN